MEIKKPREIALKVLNDVSVEKDYSAHQEPKVSDSEQLISESSNQEGAISMFIEERLEKILQNIQLSDKDRRLVWELCLGVKKWQLTLDWLISQKTKVHSRENVLLNILRLGVYQIIFLTKIPNHAAVNESVELTKKFGISGYTSLVNAVLRAFTREREQMRELLKQIKKSQPHIGYSHPEWLYLRWKKIYGEENVIKLFKWNNTPPKTYARLNTLRTSADNLMKKWTEEAVEFKKINLPYIKEELVYEVKSHPPFGKWESLQAGWFYIQDPSTLLSVTMLQPREGEKILDFCAAPGGKTTFIAQLINNKGTIFAYDSDVSRLDILKENLSRLGTECCKVISPEQFAELETNAPYDRVLVDVPCSNTGVMRRRIELRWRLKPQKIKSLQQNQFEILSKAARYVRNGGAIVYSTCSIEPEENNEVIRKFLNQHPEYKLDCEKQLLPYIDGVDGAYAARLIKNK
ncbi:MAG TPA: 16S rRNA (cytosine(967)-C(5))-methyltransferase RsmB [Verrucomicrobiota bacterium]|nr:16S rRNA (cytosine(967)-C(5))-methyltransferase RsmB [Verrucomicrobiota bacterium]